MESSLMSTISSSFAMKQNAVASSLLMVVFLIGCHSLPVDKGRSEFLKGNFHVSRMEMEKAEQMHVDASQKSVVAITWDEAQKLFIRGPYAPMYRDALQGYFYMALDSLGQRRTDDAVAAFDQMLAVHEQIALQFAEPRINEMSDEMKEKDLQSMLSYLPTAEELSVGTTAEEKMVIDANKAEINEKRAKHEAQFKEIWEKATAELQRTDQYADNGLVAFYNPVALLLATFLNGFNGNPHALKTAETCLTAIRGIAPETSHFLWKCLERPMVAFHGKVMVVVATGHGPRLTSHNIDLNGIIGTKVFAFTDLSPKAECLAIRNMNFDPLLPVTVTAGSLSLDTELAVEMYDSLNAEFQRRKSRLMREQIIRVLVRDVAATASSIYVGVKYNKLVGGAIAGGWFFLRQPLMAPDVRCMEEAPWAYQVAFLDIPEDRRLMLKFQYEPWVLPVEIPSSYDSAVVYVNIPGDAQSKEQIQILPVNLGNTHMVQTQE